MADTDVIFALLTPELWWLWEMVAIFCYFSVKFFRHWNKDRHVLLRKVGEGWQQIGEYWTDGTAKWFRTKKKRSFSTEPQTAAYSSTDISGQHRTIFHNYDKARPRSTVFDATNDKGQMKVNIKDHAPGNPHPRVPADDPDSTGFDTFVAGEAWKQTLKANTLARPEIVFSLLLIVGAFLAGFVLGPYFNPHIVQGPIQVTTSVTTTGAP